MFFTKGDILCVHIYIGCCILGVNKINRRKQRSENADKEKELFLGRLPREGRELLEQIGISFEVRVSDKEEVYHSLIPEEIVKELALSKAENVADDLREKQEQVKQISFDKKK